MRIARVLMLGMGLAVCSWPVQAADQPAATQAADNGLKYNDGAADGKKSLGGSGEMIRFTLPQDKQKIGGVRIHGSRYGLPKAPDEKFLIYFVSADGKDVIGTQMAPYSTFERGEEKWEAVHFAKPVEVPKDFWVVLDFRAAQTKGVYVSYDTSTGGKHSKTGLPGIKPEDVEFGGDWMIELLPGKSAARAEKVGLRPSLRLSDRKCFADGPPAV